MDNEIKDLDLLFPDDKVAFSFTGKKDRQKYSITLFIPHGLTLYMADKKTPPHERQVKCLSLFLRAQYDHMTEQWIIDNLSLTKQNAIFGAVIKEVGRSNDFLSDGAMSDLVKSQAVKLAADMLKAEAST